MRTGVAIATVTALAVLGVAGYGVVAGERKSETTPPSKPTAAQPGPAQAAPPEADAAQPAGNATASIVKPDSEWRKLLSDKEYSILVESKTERAFTGQFWDHHDKGVYVCAASGVPLFSSEDKFDSGTGWPSFTKPIDPAAVRLVPEKTWGGTAIEVEDAATGFHLGHVFDDGPAPTGKRYCINSAALRFVPAAK